MGPGALGGTQAHREAAALTAVVILSAVLAALVIGFLLFFRYSRTPEWGDSELRKAVLRVVVAVGPLLGMRYTPPRPAPPAVTAMDGERDGESPAP